MTQSKFEFEPFLPDHADLLRERAAAPGPCLLDHRVRRHCAAQAGAGHRDVVFDRHRRARAEDRALGQGWPDARRRSLPTKIAGEFRGLWDRLGLTYDDFIRTTEERHKRGVQKLFATLRDKGFIYKGSYTGQYCVSDEAYVDGPPGTLCPDCGRIDGDGERGELFLQALGLRAQAAGVLRGESRVHGAGVDAARGDLALCAAG